MIRRLQHFTPVHAGWLLLIPFLMAAHCVSTGSPPFLIPFEYRGLGVGPNEVNGRILLPRGAEERFVSRAIVEALGKLEFSLNPPLGPFGALPAGGAWQTDTVPLSAAQLEAYNASVQGTNAGLSLPPHAIYGVQFTGRYEVQDREIGFMVSALLYHRGLASPFTRYPREYSGNYFVERLQAGIVASLQRLTVEAAAAGAAGP